MAVDGDASQGVRCPLALLIYIDSSAKHTLSRSASSSSNKLDDCSFLKLVVHRTFWQSSEWILPKSTIGLLPFRLVYEDSY